MLDSDSSLFEPSLKKLVNGKDDKADKGKGKDDKGKDDKADKEKPAKKPKQDPKDGEGESGKRKKKVEADATPLPRRRK